MKPNIVLITMDSLRSDHVSCYGYKRKTTPEIDKFIKCATLYENTYVNGPNTPNSFPSIMCSRYRLESEGFQLKRYWETIASILSKEGYNTVGYNSGNSWISSFFGYNKGFKIFNCYLDQSFRWDDKKIGQISKGKTKIFKKNTKINKIKLKLLKYIDEIIINNFVKRKKLLDKKFGDDVKSIINEVNPPFFIWIHYMDVHWPYVPEKKYCIFGKAFKISNIGFQYLNYLVRLNRDCNNKTIKKIIDIYDSSILQNDYKIGVILNSLKKRNLFHNSMIVITSDHGECFKEHGNFSHCTYDAYNELLKVPLAIKYPFQKSSIRKKNDVSLINLVPTIIDVLKIKSDYFFHGKSLIQSDNVKNEIIFSEGYNLPKLNDLVCSTKLNTPRVYVVKDNNWKLLFDFKNDKYQLFDLKHDPDEKSNIINKKKKILHKMIKMLDDHIDKEKRTAKLEMNIQNKLRNLKKL